LTKTKEIRNYLEMYGLDKNTQDICDAVGCAPRTVQQVRKDYKAEMFEVQLASTEIAVVTPAENLEYICEGCPRADTTEYTCGVYAEPPSIYVRGGCCPFNKPSTTRKKVRVRVGQQKQRR
jgi:hypothetical protein